MPTSWLRGRNVLDRLAAACLALLLSPMLGILALLVRRDGDAAPPFIRLPRVGRDGRMIRVWKVRTMRSAGPDGSAGGATLTRGDADERVTPIGRRLRRHRLDELPQLWNVVMGDMALLGPRPEAPAYVSEDARWGRVLSVRPGIAGPTQLLVHEWEAAAMGSDDFERVYRQTILPVKLDIDAWYVSRASPWVDLVVAWSLLDQFILGRPPKALRRLKDIPSVPQP